MPSNLKTEGQPLGLQQSEHGEASWSEVEQKLKHEGQLRARITCGCTGQRKRWEDTMEELVFEMNLKIEFVLRHNAVTQEVVTKIRMQTIKTFICTRGCDSFICNGESMRSFKYRDKIHEFIKGDKQSGLVKEVLEGQL